ncbi:unnamed protein product [Nezara viridula]|uniref:Uncharacterized protein n=1 Tax=Nezara viridula TaxID=85310 RepID=A0A9P0MHH6_NEZVI|nr:unnamed protein product [Nezara viridula]
MSHDYLNKSVESDCEKKIELGSVKRISWLIEKKPKICS